MRVIILVAAAISLYVGLIYLVTELVHNYVHPIAGYTVCIFLCLVGCGSVLKWIHANDRY